MKLRPVIHVVTMFHLADASINLCMGHIKISYEVVVFGGWDMLT